MRKGLTYILLLLSVIAMGCTKENLEDCFAGVRLRFRFTLHQEPDKGNLFGQNVGHVRAYVFDQSGVLRLIETQQGSALTNDYVMPLDLEPGHYSVVVWASDNENFARTYDALHATPTYTELEVGRSRMEDLRILLKSEAANDYPEDTKPLVDNFDDLYFGAVGTRSDDGKSLYTVLPIEVTTTAIAEYEVELIRNTNIVRMTIEGWEHLTQEAIEPARWLDIWATGTNTQYQYNNLLEPQALSVRNFPQYTLVDAHTVQADVKIERLEWAKQNGERVQLHAQFKNGKTLYSGELLSLLKEARDASGNAVYKNQEDLDRIYVHPIRFVVAKDDAAQDISIKVFVHNWQIVVLHPEL